MLELVVPDFSRNLGSTKALKKNFKRVDKECIFSDFLKYYLNFVNQIIFFNTFLKIKKTSQKSMPNKV